MKNPARLIQLSLVLCAAAFLMTVGDWLALHDIRHDYVSPRVVEVHAGSAAADIPTWSGTPAEWKMVEWSAWVRLAYFVVSAVALFACWRKWSGERGGGAASVGT